MGLTKPLDMTTLDACLSAVDAEMTNLRTITGISATETFDRIRNRLDRMRRVAEVEHITSKVRQPGTVMLRFPNNPTEPVEVASRRRLCEDVQRAYSFGHDITVPEGVEVIITPMPAGVA